MRLLLLILILSSVKVCAQEHHTFRNDYSYVDFLLQNKRFDDALFFLNNYNRFTIQQKPAADSLSYLKGIAFYHQGAFDSSFYHLHLVNEGSPLYTKATYAEAFSLIGKNQIPDAITEIEKTPSNPNDTIIAQLKLFELASAHLLNRNYIECEKKITMFQGDYYLLSDEKEQLAQHYIKLTTRRKKYPWLAASLSAVVPGAGKAYSGQIGHAIATFTMIGVLGGITAESYYRSGKNDIQFWAAGTLLTVFYIGNIYGSYFSVRVKNEQFNNEINKSIIFNMRVPVSRILN